MRSIPNRTKRGGFTIVELLVVVALLAVAVAIFTPSLCRSRETANRVKCASNLRQIGQALSLYANDNKGALPRMRFVADAPPTWGTGASAATPFADDGPAPNDVSAAMFLLMRTQEITAEVFTC